MKLVRKLLFPVVPVYYSVTWLRNVLFDANILKSQSYDFPVICVGNLSVGGTGKSPMIEYLIRLLQNDYKVATLSRGYKRTTKGFQIAGKDANVSTIGDEPFQFYSKFQDEITVAVDGDRQNGISNLRALNNSPDVILLDDAFQHRKVRAGLNILLTTYDNLYANDIVLPTGDLREPISGAKRADIVIVTKCPNDIGVSEQNIIEKKLKLSSYQKLFFSFIDYSNSIHSLSEVRGLQSLTSEFALVTGIANATPLLNFLKNSGLNFKHLNFGDHHNFTQDELEQLNTHDFILTTEKDFMRLKDSISADKLFYLPIQAQIFNNELFDQSIKKFVASF